MAFDPLSTTTTELLTPAEMGQADRLAMQQTPGTELMRAAGEAVADSVRADYPPATRVVVIASTGNNGGDGFVAAESLRRTGYHVDVRILGKLRSIARDAQWALSQMSVPPSGFNIDALNDAELVIDAIFGAGLMRDISGPHAECIAAINQSGLPVIAIDLPSGIDGNSGLVRGIAVKAAKTITFFRYKPGHFLYPGRLHCGALQLAQIGISDTVLDQISPQVHLNSDTQWRPAYPFLKADTHKFHRGHAVAFAGPPEMTGAARLMADAALRAGAGLVTMACTPASFAVIAPQLTSVMVKPYARLAELEQFLHDPRITCVCLGPGLPADADTRKTVLNVLNSPAAIVLDAGAISAFTDCPDILFSAITDRSGPVVMTPHAGEFERLFGKDDTQSKTAMAKAAATASGAHIVFKGPDTVIAAPSGEISINAHAPPWLATAGSGDVLAGIIAGLLARGMPPFEAACAGVWLHSDAANRIGPGLVSSDLDGGLRAAISALERAGYDGAS